MADASLVDDTRIRERAYALWEEEGCPEGCADRHWQQAEDELRQSDALETTAASGAAKPRSTKVPDGSARRARPRSTAA